MKKYRLIEEYPGSPLCGEIKTSEWVNYKTHILKFPHFWQKISGEDFKILSYYIKNNVDCILYETHEGSGVWQGKGMYSIAQYTKKELDNNMVGIHSIKRLEDDAVFTIGDRIDGVSYKDREITGFTESIDREGDAIIKITQPGGFTLLESAKHSKVFETKDGKKVAKDDLVYVPYTNGKGKWCYKHEPLYKLKDVANVITYHSFQECLNFIEEKNEVVFISQDGVKMKKGMEIHIVIVDLHKDDEEENRIDASILSYDKGWLLNWKPEISKNFLKFGFANYHNAKNFVDSLNQI